MTYYPPLEDLPDEVLQRFVWIHSIKRVGDRLTGLLLDRDQFNVLNSRIGPPHSRNECAWAKLLQHPRLCVAGGVTFRPGHGRAYRENLPGLTGRCFNLWNAPTTPPTTVVRESDVAPWLTHLAYVIPDHDEREWALDWMAWVVQHQSEKPNWQLVLGGGQGIGKDLLLHPLRTAIGTRYVREIGPTELLDSTDWLDKCKLAVVQEMNSFGRKGAMDGLKRLAASPPTTIRVNVKYVPVYEVPNLVALVLLTNHENALALETDDRRFFVVWSPAKPKSQEYYGDLVRWYEDGGLIASASYLLARDVSCFDVRGVAPQTAAKQAMCKVSHSPLAEALKEALDARLGPFAYDLVTTAEVCSWAAVHFPGSFPSESAVSRLLRSLAAEPRTHTSTSGEPIRVRLGAAPAGCPEVSANDQRRASLFSIRNHEATRPQQGDGPALARAYWAERLVFQ